MAVQSTLLLVVMLTTLPANGAMAGAQAWVRYTHPQLGFSLSYPESWTEQAISGADFAAIGPMASGVPAVRLNVNVTHEAVPEGMSVDVYHVKTEEVLKTIFNGYHLVQTTQAKAGAVPAVIREYTWKLNNGIEITQLQLVTVDGNRGFVVTGTTSTASTKLPDETKLLGRILVSFQPR